MDAKTKYQEWLDRLPEGDPLREELLGIAGDDNEIEERFYQYLTFGTAGLRGIVGAGTNRMNMLTVGKTTQGIADYIKGYGQEAMDRGVVIAHDPRYYSREFCELAASILAANGIKAYIYPSMRPTPQLAYSVRYLGTIAGINITASHNPKIYNGYKAYWEDGCQVGRTVANGMYEKILQVDEFTGVKKADFDEAIADGRIVVLGPEYDRAYLDAIEAMAIHHGDELDLDIPFVFTPLNGCSSIPFRQMLEDRGFHNWAIVEEQKDPDPEFTTVGYPNPEDPKAFKLAEELGRKFGAELLMATDPDGDRFVIEIRDENGNYKYMNGNQTGYLLLNYVLEGKKDAGTLPKNGAVIKSIVTSDLSTRIADAYGVRMYEALTGFPSICGRIPEITAQGYEYQFAYEQSVGYAVCPEVRDKDGISAGMMVAEAAAYFRKQGKTLWDVLQEIYAKYGYCNEDEPSVILEGLAGQARIKRMMEYVRANLPTEVAGAKVVKVIDYLNGYEDILPSNVLRFYLDNDSWFAIRPSGTEPKIKFYFYSIQDSAEKAAEVNKKIKDEVFAMVQSVE